MNRQPHPAAQVLREVRIKKNIQQNELARSIGVNAAAICQWETGARYPTWFNFICWADSLGVEVVVKEKTNALD